MFGEEYGIFDSINKTYTFLIKSKRNAERHRTSIHFIKNHLPILRKYGKLCSHITEFGIDQCISTWAFLAARPRKLISIDIDLHKRSTKFVPEFKKYNWWLDSAQKLAQKENICFEVFEEDTLKIEIEDTDLLFVDSLHRNYHIDAELSRHIDKVKKFLIFHDTGLFREIVPIIERHCFDKFDLVENLDRIGCGLRIYKRKEII